MCIVVCLLVYIVIWVWGVGGWGGGFVGLIGVLGVQPTKARFAFQSVAASSSSKVTKSLKKTKIEYLGPAKTKRRNKEDKIFIRAQIFIRGPTYQPQHLSFDTNNICS